MAYRNLNDLAGRIAEANRAQGWHARYHVMLDNGAYDTGDLLDHIASKIALIHSEASEALEELRTGYPPAHRYEREDGKPEGFVVELADVLIRVLDLAGMLDLDIEGAVADKLDFNTRRAYMHGKAL